MSGGSFTRGGSSAGMNGSAASGGSPPGVNTGGIRATGGGGAGAQSQAGASGSNGAVSGLGGTATGSGGSGTSGGAGGQAGTAGSGGAGTQGGAGGSGGGSAGTFKQVADLLARSCATSSMCHGPGAAQTPFSGKSLYNTLLSDKRGVGHCNYDPLVVPGNPKGSALYEVIGGWCGNFQMPPSCTENVCPTEDDWNMLGSWILDGAPNN